MSNYNPTSKDYEDLKNVNFPNYGRLLESQGKPEDGKANHPFFFPGSKPPHINKNMGGKNDVFRPLSKMRRGFMRSILFDTGGNNTVLGTKRTGNVRLNFQFNPEYIERNVAQSQGAVNPLLQNPANLTQPVPGTASFNFTMTFNREYEVANRDRDLEFRFKNAPANDLTFSSSADFTTQSMLGELSNPQYSGVLHDLSIFDKIIGQGISQDVIETIAKFNAKVAEIQQSLAGQGTNANQNNQFVQGTPFSEAAFKKTLSEKNFGNSAFINPLPVRIVFGDLFMVEGFVTGSAVAFQKFSHQMIPTICQVNCTVQALYFGFAKRKAFLTDSLADWYKSVVTPSSQGSAQSKIDALKYVKDITHVQMLWNHSNDDPPARGLSGDYYNLDMPNQDSDYTKVLAPTNTWEKTNGSNERYAGNSQGYITLRQWWNTFSKIEDGTKINVTPTTAKTYLEMAEEKVLEGQLRNMLGKAGGNPGDSDAFVQKTQVPSADALYTYTPLMVSFRFLHPLVKSTGTQRVASLPDNSFFHLFNLELTKLYILYSSNKRAPQKYEIDIKTLSSQEIDNWSIAWRTWVPVGKKMANGKSYTPHPLDPGTTNGWRRQAPKSKTDATDFFKVYWVRPKDTSDVLPKAYDYTLYYEFGMTVNSNTYKLTNRITSQYTDDAPFLVNSLNPAVQNTIWDLTVSPFGLA